MCIDEHSNQIGSCEWRYRGTNLETFQKATDGIFESVAGLIDPSAPFEWKMNLLRLASRRLGGQLYMTIIAFECTADWDSTVRFTDDDIVMVVPTRGRLTYRFTDGVMDVPKGHGIVYQSVDKFNRRAFTDNGLFSAVGLRVSQLKVQRVLSRRSASVNKPELNFRHLIDTSTDSFSIMIKSLELLTSAAQGFSNLSGECLDAFMDALAQLLFDVIGSIAPDNATAHIPLSAPVVRRARQYIDDHFKTKITIRDIATHVGVSVRKLERDFKDNLGTSPARYLKDVRLNHIHSVLIRGKYGRSVSMVAKDSGYTNRSRFLRDYIAKFGELPKETREHES